MNKDTRIDKNLLEKAISLNKGICLELATGYGKTKLAINTAQSLASQYRIGYNILILVDRTLHKQNWEEEITKWGGFAPNVKVTYACYASLKKYANSCYDIIICDEAHHLYTDSRISYFESISAKKYIYLSATLQKDFKYYLMRKGTKFFSIGLVDAIQAGVLPSPKIIKIPLQLPTKEEMWIVINGNSKKEKKFCTYSQMWEFRSKFRKHPIYVKCNAAQKYAYMSKTMEYYKQKNMSFQMKRLGMQRLKWLSEQREVHTSSLLYTHRNERTITFCSSIAQADRLGAHSIHSKNKDSMELYDAFNAGSINHITACSMLNEGMNLIGCKVAIFANYNASETKCIQRIGRALRHKEPVILMPYFVGTREEQIVNTILKDYDKSVITTVKWKKK